MSNSHLDLEGRLQAQSAHAAQQTAYASRDVEERHLDVDHLERHHVHQESHAAHAAGRGQGAQALAGKARNQPELGAAGRVFEFARGAGRPVVEKTAFFEGFGWVLCLEDASMWAQLLDGSQVVVSQCEAMYVGPADQRRVLAVADGHVQVACITFLSMPRLVCSHTRAACRLR